MVFIDTNTADDEAMRLFLRKALQVAAVSLSEPLQALWGGQGCIVRVSSNSTRHPSAVLKVIRQNRQADHPRGWNSKTSFDRKARSYAVECCWYEQYAARCDAHCRVPATIGVFMSDTQRLILLEDLSVQYPERRDRLTVDEVAVCLSWLAHFHALFLGVTADGLWQEGSYWQLNTRQDEFQAMEDGPVKRAADQLDEQLRLTRYRTLIHGDAKVANFCFSADMKQVAAVDFQYVGGGCGMRDVVYLLGSCLSPEACQEHEQILLDKYFLTIRRAMQCRYALDTIDELEEEWRNLYEVAWTDFYRFLLGWMPSHSKVNDYAIDVADRALRKLHQ